MNRPVRRSLPSSVAPLVVRSVVRALQQAHGLPRHGNPRRPLDDLFYVILSNKTTPSSARGAYRSLRRAFPSWRLIYPSDLPRVRAILEPAGLANVRAAQIVGIVGRLRAEFGEVTLAPLRRMQPSEAETFLARLPGVSLKVAKCVLMYTLALPVLPVDSHVHRLAVRLGWTRRKRADQSHEDLERAVPPPLRYAFHVCAITHGREICRPREPLCGSCTVNEFCAYYREGSDAG